MRNVKQIYTVIVTYNGAQWIEKCVESLRVRSMDNNIILVDNGSTDSTLNIIREKHKQVCIIEQTKNLGFGKANNIGISYALQKGADYVFLLNQDTYIEENTLEKLVEVSNENPDFGILSPLQLSWDGTKLEHYFAKFTAANPNFYSDYVLKKDLKKIYDIPFVNAAAWLIPARIIESIGGFDSIFRHYGEDNNYCQRMQYHGFKIGIVPNTFIFHDSYIRKEPSNYLFSEAYYHNEVKELQIKYADITKNYSQNDFNAIRKHIGKLIGINLFKFKFNYVKGYLKKYRIFEESIIRIEKSRKQNILKGPHYLDK